MTRGVVVALEGLDGSGKSTLASRLASWLASEGAAHRVLTMYGSPLLARQLAALNARGLIGPRDASLMYAADLSARVAHVAEPLVAEGGVMIWDKYLVGARVRDRLRGLPLDLLDAVYEPVPEPDVAVYVAVPPEVATARKRARGRPSMWECGLDVFLDLPVAEIERRLSSGALPDDEVFGYLRRFQEQVHEGYEKELAARPHLRVDGTRPVDDVFVAVRDAVRARGRGEP